MSNRSGALRCRTCSITSLGNRSRSHGCLRRNTCRGRCTKMRLILSGGITMSAQSDERANSRAREQRMGLANRPRLEDYREKYAKHFKMERRDGILQVQMHTDGGPLNFNLHVHNDWPQLWMDIGNDPDNEVLIFTGAGDKWIGGFVHQHAPQPIHSRAQDSFFDHNYSCATQIFLGFFFYIYIPPITLL